MEKLFKLQELLLDNSKFFCFINFLSQKTKLRGHNSL